MEMGQHRNKPDRARALLSNLPRRQQPFTTSEQTTRAQRGYAACKGSHSTAGRKLGSDWLPGSGRGNDLVYTQLEREGRKECFSL